MHCEFSLNHYKECIELARDKGYSIIPVKDYREHAWTSAITGKKLSSHDKVILLRHDIDFSLEYAYELANIEYDLGVCSSYYVYLHSPTYNALSPKSMGMIKAMKGMGHEIGLHYDSRYWAGGEFMILDSITDDYSESWTQHNPGMTEDMDDDRLLDPNKLELKYISDSGRNWREGCMCNHIGKVDKLHILVHAEWWLNKGNSRDEVLRNMIIEMKESLDKEHVDIVKQMKDYCRDLGIEY